MHNELFFLYCFWSLLRCLWCCLCTAIWEKNSSQNWIVEYLCPRWRPVHIVVPVLVCGFLLRLSLMIVGRKPNTSFLPHRCSAVKTFFFFLTRIKTFFFHPVKGFNPKFDGASTLLILVCLNWASLLLLFKIACYFPWSVCLSSGPVLSSDCLF